MWFREHDLRVLDNTALYHASQLSPDGLIAIFILSPEEWGAHDMSPCRAEFILQHLAALSQNLLEFNIPLLIEFAENKIDVIKLLLETIDKHQIKQVFYNEQYEINESRRDAIVASKCAEKKIKIFSFHDQVVLPPGEVLTQSGKYFTVFTPFKRAWLKKLAEKGGVTVFPSPKKQIKLSIISSTVPKQINNFTNNIDISAWPIGEKQAFMRLSNFIQNKVDDYQDNRNFPFKNATSRLSPYLTSGIISARQCLSMAKEFNNQQLNTGNVGITTWINELIWREFYKHILKGFPRVSMGRPFRLATEKISWHNNLEHFEAWKKGLTGFPIIDAAMRQLNQTGWMHNRLRMLTAMFLSKNLLIDWRWGEKYFMQHLIDGDLSANNGGWQWSASTGTDSAPYFRIFNPITQSEKFDPEGKFIKEYCPELRLFSGKAIHNPTLWPVSIRNKLDYPSPQVNLSETRARAISIFKMLS